MPRPSIASLAGALSCVFVPFAAQAQSAASGLPEGEGKELVEGVCTGCHQTNQITRSSGYTREGWKELTGTMIDLSGSPEDQEAITRYLGEHFPPNDQRAPTLVPGEAEIAFKEWQVPTLGQRSRDPVEAADGSIWWAGQLGNLVGRIDPATGEMKEYPLPANALPHTVVLDDAGNVWYTGNKNGTIGKLDPKTGEVTAFAMPDPAAKDPHTAVFDGNGILWFTLQQSNMIGRLDPASGDVKLVTMKTPDARPYGIKIDASGVPWVACNGSNCLVKVDPATMELTEVEAAGRGDHRAPPRHRRRRHDLVRQLVAGPPRPARPARPARSGSGRRRAGRSPTPTPSRWWTASSGTTSPACGRTRSSASIRRRRHSRAGRSRRAASMPGIVRHMRPTRGRQPADPPEQHQPHHPGDAAGRHDAVGPRNAPCGAARAPARDRVRSGRRASTSTSSRSIPLTPRMRQAVDRSGRVGGGAGSSGRGSARARSGSGAARGGPASGGRRSGPATGGGPIGLGRPACREFGRRRVPGLERLERAQAAGELGERRAAVAQQRGEGAGAVAVAGQDRAEIGLAALAASSSASIRSARARRQAATATRCASTAWSAPAGASSSSRAASSARNPAPSSSASTTYLLRPQAVLERVLRRARLALGGLGPRDMAPLRRLASARAALVGTAAQSAAPTLDMAGFLGRGWVNGRGRTEEREPERSFYAVIGIMCIAAVEPRLRCRALLARPHGGSHQRCRW